jgi:hypothetical protein
VYCRILRDARAPERRPKATRRKRVQDRTILSDGLDQDIDYSLSLFRETALADSGMDIVDAHHLAAGPEREAYRI